MQSGGRQYRNTDEVYVRDWDSFKKSWKDNKCIKEWGDPNSPECKELIKKSLNQLINDQTAQCYVFPDSLKPEYIAIITQLLSSQSSGEFKVFLDFQHEGMYLDKPKQLIVFKRRASVSSYLSKYRLNNDYKKHFEIVNQICKAYQLLISERNLKISQQLSKEEIDAFTQKIKVFEATQLEPKLSPWRNLVIRSVQDFKKQPKKQEIMFIGVNSLLVRQIKKICSQNELYYGNRYEKISDYDEYRDFYVTKYDRSEPSYSFDDKSSSSDQAEIPQPKNEDWQKQIVMTIPRNIETVDIKGFSQNGAKCNVSILSFGKLNPVQSIKIRLAYPLVTQEQKKYEQTIAVTQAQYQYECILHCLHSGYSRFQIKTANSVGECKKPYILEIWMEGDKQSMNKQGIMKISQKNSNLYILGQNQDGLIPNWSPQNQNIIRTTSQAWQQFKFVCSDFSVSSHGVICNNEGQVAGWGKMYYFDEEGLNQDQKEDEEQDDLGLARLDTQKYRTEIPSLILQSEYIRKVSCGEGYCLMADSLGRAWSFGLNMFGQLGLEHNNESVDTSEPTKIPYFKVQKIFVVDVVASYFGASFAIDNNGQAYRWGSNQVQQTDTPIKDSYNNIINYQYPDITIAQTIPTLISKKLITEKIVSIHPGMQFVLALTESNKLYGWGNTNYLGIGNTEDAHFQKIQNFCNPVPVLDGVSTVSVGHKHVVAHKLDKNLVGWGKSHCYLKGKSIKQSTNKPETISENFEGYFTCGPDFTVFEEKENSIRVIGNSQIFKEGTYKLPCQPIKVKAGEGVVVAMGKKISDGQKDTKQEKQGNITESEEIKQKQ